MNYGEIIAQAARQLQRRKIANARQEAELLLVFVVNKSIEYIITHSNINLTNLQLQKYHALMLRRYHHEPMAYILKSAIFCGHSFSVNRHTLIPRPETEQLVEIASSIIKQNHVRSVTELGTGSGAIAITLAQLFPNLTLHASDISSEALRVAKTNAQHQQVLKRITLKRGNLLKPWRQTKYELLIVNLPYVSRAELKNSPTRLELKYEPRQALYGGVDGLDIYREMIQQIAKLDYPPKYVLIENGWKQSKQITQIAKEHLSNYITDIVRDHNQVQRFAVLSRG